MNQPVLFDYAAAGGRILASHFHYSWFNTGPFGAYPLATWKTGSNQIGNELNAQVVTAGWDGGTFARGQSLYDWLATPKVAALTSGELPIEAPRHNADLTAANTLSQPWLIADPQSQSPGAVQAMTFDTPLGTDAGGHCGRVEYTDLHIGASSGDYSSSAITPTGCATGNLAPQEAALEYLLFDVMACVTVDNAPTTAP